MRSGRRPLEIHFQREAGDYFGPAVKLRSGEESGHAPVKPPARVLVRTHGARWIFRDRRDLIPAPRSPLIHARTAATPASHLNGAEDIIYSLRPKATVYYENVQIVSVCLSVITPKKRVAMANLY